MSLLARLASMRGPTASLAPVSVKEKPSSDEEEEEDKTLTTTATAPSTPVEDKDKDKEEELNEDDENAISSIASVVLGSQLPAPAPAPAPAAAPAAAVPPQQEEVVEEKGEEEDEVEEEDKKKKKKTTKVQPVKQKRNIVVIVKPQPDSKKKKKKKAEKRKRNDLSVCPRLLSDCSDLDEQISCMRGFLEATNSSSPGTNAEVCREFFAHHRRLIDDSSIRRLRESAVVGDRESAYISEAGRNVIRQLYLSFANVFEVGSFKSNKKKKPRSIKETHFESFLSDIRPKLF